VPAAGVQRDAGKTGAVLDAATLERHTHEHPMLAGFKRPRAYRFVEEIPLTATGKKLHYKVREQARADAAAGLLERP
jgi:acyl-CoA synthetase (AMP-forming)/AMP-acid ligase II